MGFAAARREFHWDSIRICSQRGACATEMSANEAKAKRNAIQNHGRRLFSGTKQCETKGGCLEEYTGNTNCKATGNRVKTILLKRGQWTAVGRYTGDQRVSFLGFECMVRRTNYIYLALGNQQQCTSASNAKTAKLKTGG